MATYFKPFVQKINGSYNRIYPSNAAGDLNVDLYTAPSNRYAIIYIKSAIRPIFGNMVYNFTLKNNSFPNISISSSGSLTDGTWKNIEGSVLVSPGETFRLSMDVSGSESWETTNSYTIVEFET